MGAIFGCADGMVPPSEGAAGPVRNPQPDRPMLGDEGVVPEMVMSESVYCGAVVQGGLVRVGLDSGDVAPLAEVAGLNAIDVLGFAELEDGWLWCDRAQGRVKSVHPAGDEAALDDGEPMSFDEPVVHEQPCEALARFGNSVVVATPDEGKESIRLDLFTLEEQALVWVQVLDTPPGARLTAFALDDGWLYFEDGGHLQRGRILGGDAREQLGPPRDTTVPLTGLSVVDEQLFLSYRGSSTIYGLDLDDPAAQTAWAEGTPNAGLDCRPGRSP